VLKIVFGIRQREGSREQGAGREIYFATNN
jgi:hypothetical protein